ncbi:hypothetical protein L7F22_004406 [Adiantum nelumboides]|nr:hypothetical protein [Adiantum nelumboides]
MAELGRGSAAGSALQVAGLALLLALQFCALRASAATLTVGGSDGWDIRVDYTAWAASQTFAIGDVLSFPYTSGAHDVVQVDKAGYDACSAASPIATHTDGNTNVALPSAGNFYFLCSFLGHCDAGMKLAVLVGAASAPSPNTSVGTPTSAPSPSPPAPPPNASVSTPSPSIGSAAPASTPTPASTSTSTPPPTLTPAPTPSPSPANAPVPSSTPSPVNAPVPTPGSVGAPPLASAPPVSSPPSPPNVAPRLSSANSLAAALLILSAAVLAAL